MTDELIHVCASTLDAETPRLPPGAVVDMPMDSCAFCNASVCVQSLADGVVLHMHSKEPKWKHYGQMPEYRRKAPGGEDPRGYVVRAVKISSVERHALPTEPSFGVRLDGLFAVVPVTKKWVESHRPIPGGYFIVMPSMGGWRTFQTAEQFESEYELVAEG